jgi:hypothetical protein
MRPGPKLTTVQRQQLLASYLTRGLKGTKQLAESYGVQPRYLAQLARASRSRISKRWETAIERGNVIA